VRLVRYVLIFVLTCCACAAQSITIGAIGGARLTDDVLFFNTSGANLATGAPPFRLESRFYDVGPAIEVGLPRGLSVEFDALYHRQDFFHTFAEITFYQTYSERDNLWEFPLLLKYALRRHTVNPFVEAGVVPRTMTGRITQISQSDFVTPGPPSTSMYPADHAPNVGFVAGGGVQFNLSHLRIGPQVRYTRWFSAPVQGAVKDIGGFSSNLNQVDLLVGFSWRLR
jgi:hypothetical protein